MSEESRKLLGRINVRGLDATELVRSDPILLHCAFIEALGGHAFDILAKSRVCRLRPDRVAFSAGQPAASVFLVAAGELTVRDPSEEQLLGGSVAVGEITGAEAALGEATRVKTAAATGEAVVVEVPASALLELLPGNEPLACCLDEANERDLRAAGDMADFLDRW